MIDQPKPEGAPALAGPAGFTPPLKVHVCWFPGPAVDEECAAIAKELYEFLHRPIADDPVQRPGLEIPVEHGRSLASLLTALETPPGSPGHEPPAGARVVVGILDKAAYGSPAHREVVQRALARWPGKTRDAAASPNEVFLPVVLDKRWHAELIRWQTELTGQSLQMRPAVNVGDSLADKASRRWRLPSDVAVVAGRALLRALGTPEPPKPSVFISHTKADGVTLAKGLAVHFKTETHVDAWYDAVDVDRGDELARQLEDAASQGVVLVIRTDRYSESPWCGLELLAAKRSRAPIVTLLAASDGEPSTSAYGGNHRTMTWGPGREWEVVGRCVQAWLHGHHFAAHAAAALAHAGLPADAEVVSRRPELLDLAAPRASSGRRIIVYPDPPLTEGEAALLRAAQPSLRLVTPTTMLGRVLLANDPSPPLTGRTLAFSLSFAEDLRAFDDAGPGPGLTQSHLEDVLYSIVLTTLHTGARIAYGGDFRKHGGYAAKLSDLHRARRRLGTGAGSQLVCYLDEAGLRAGDAEVEYWPVPIPALARTEGYSAPVRDTLWHLAMRQTMADQSDGRVVLGGKIHAAQTDDDKVGYRSPWPGVLEEAWRTLLAGKALYVVGGFGGFAGLLARMLIADQVASELTAATHAGTRLARLAAEVDVARRELAEGGADRDVLLALGEGTFAGIEELANLVLERWRQFRAGDASAWPNGLVVDENLRLFRSTDRTEITHLVFEGLRQVTRRPTADLEIALYHGDIASISEVDGYAVTTTPGMPNVGALASLDRSMSGRLGRAVASATWREDVAGVPAETDTLAGRQVLVARVELPAVGEAITTARVAALAAAVARACDKLGIESIAAAPFATTMGLSPPEAVLAMLAGLRAGGGHLPRRLVLCDVDRVRYEGVRSALKASGHTVRELRAGPRPSRATDTVVLHVEATLEEPDRSVRIRTTAYAPDAGRAVVPRHATQLTAEEWKSLRTRATTFPGSVATGRVLRDRLLSDDLRALLARHADRRLLLLTNDQASGLPWELLEGESGTPPSIGHGLVRRIALSGDARPPADRASTDAHLRVLLVVNPRGDLAGAAAEGHAVATALAGRQDIVVTRVEGGAATRTRVQNELTTGYYDVLHYAGHAYFDPAHRSDSGLRLADGTFTAADLGSGTVPRLVVLSACESARVRGPDGDTAVAAETGQPLPEQTDGEAALRDVDDQPLAEALLRAGVTTMVGTFFKVSDSAALTFATALHTSLATGKTIGDATRDARRELHGRQVSDWGNFLLYGDDSLIL